MKKILFLFLFLGSILKAQLLYQISGNGLSKPSYLYGTIHMLPKEQFRLSNSLKRAFESCQALAMELDLNMSATEKISLAQQVLLPESKTLKDFMEAQDYLKLKIYCLDTLKWSESKFERSSKLKPMFFSSILFQESMTQMASYEMEFNKMAKKKHKHILGLETVEYQLSLFDQLPMSTQIEMLKTDLQNNLSNFDTLLNAYLNEDIQQLDSLMNEESSEYPEFNEILLYNRNKSWIGIMADQMQKESTFFAVGAGHLAGPQGVVALLRQQGFKVTAIKQD